MRPGLRANTGQIKIAAHRRSWRTDCDILERLTAKIRSTSLTLEELASVDPTEARNDILSCVGRTQPTQLLTFNEIQLSADQRDELHVLQVGATGHL
jgi:hypothetical protein